MNARLLIPFIALALIPSMAIADDISHTEINRYLQELPRVGDGTATCGTDETSAECLLPRGKADKLVCGKPIDTEYFCHQIKLACPPAGCWRPSGHPEQFTEKQVRTAFRTAKQAFEDLRGDAEIQSLCCGKDEGCKKGLGGTKLLISRGIPALEKYGRFTFEDATIRVSEGTVLGCEDRECLEVLFLHELGHACQNQRMGSMAFEMAARTCMFSGGSIPVFDKLMGEKTRKCVMDALDKTPLEGKCPGSWGAEAFADLVFSSRWNRPTHWAAACEQNADAEHAPIRPYMSCIFERARPRSKVCSDS